MDETDYMPQPSPDLAAPKKAAPKKRASRGGGRPRKAAPAPRVRATPTTPVEQLAAAATSGLKNETAGGRPSNASKMEKGLVNLHVGIGAILQVLGLLGAQPRLMAVGSALDLQAEPAAAALAAWAETNSRVRAALEMFATGGGALLVLAAYAPVVKSAVTGLPPDGASALDLGALLGGLDLASMFGDDSSPAPV